MSNYDLASPRNKRESTIASNDQDEIFQQKKHLETSHVFLLFLFSLFRNGLSVSSFHASVCYVFILFVGFFFFFLELRVLLWLVPLDHTVYYTLALILMTTSGNGGNIEELGEEEIHEQESESKRKRIFFFASLYWRSKMCRSFFSQIEKKIYRLRGRGSARRLDQKSSSIEKLYNPSCCNNFFQSVFESSLYISPTAKTFTVRKKKKKRREKFLISFLKNWYFL